MGAGHVTAGGKGGTTNLNKCQMLCKTHNRAKEINNDEITPAPNN